MQGYLTLEEAAQTLSMKVDELRHMAQRNQIRSFQDRGTLRFRVQDIQELGRQRGLTSNPEEEALKGPTTPRSGEPGSGRVRKEITDFSLEVGEDDKVEIGLTPRGKSGSSGRKKGSDSDVKLDLDRDYSMAVGGDSDVKLVVPDSKSGKPSSPSRRQPPPSGAAPPVTPPRKAKSDLAGPRSGKKPSPKSAASPTPKKKDAPSGTLSQESDSDVKIVGNGGSHLLNPGKEATDSESPIYRPPADSEERILFTDEINLEEEIRKLENPSAPEGSAFELSDQDRPASSSQLGFYSLDEAALALAMSADELRQLAQRSQIRSFMDRGVLRFRVHDVKELARQRGLSGPPSPRQPSLSQFGFPAPEKEGGEGDFDFSLEVNEDQLAFGGDLVPRSGAKGGSSNKLGSKAKPTGDSDFSLEVNDDDVDLGGPPRSDKKSGSASSPRPGSDSDVRLLSDQDFSLGADSDIKLVGPESSSTRRKGAGQAATPPQQQSALSPRSPSKGRPVSSGSPSPKKSAPSSSKGIHEQPFIPADSDSDVKIVPGSVDMGRALGPTDSDIRLEGHGGSSNDEALHLTEEINLDEEIRKQEEALKKEPGGKKKIKARSNLDKSSSANLPASPFEVAGVAPAAHDSSDFDLMPAAEGPTDDSDDFSLELPDEGDSLVLDDRVGHELQGHTSGINLADPVDLGISLEFEDSAGHKGTTPRPTYLKGAAPHASDDTGSEFELSLDDSSEELPTRPLDSEFELGAATDSSMDSPSLSVDGENSEFELSLDSSDELPSQHPADSEFELGAAHESSSENPSLELSADTGSEFELSLDDSLGEVSAHGQPAGSSEFEIGSVPDSSSENPSLEIDPSGSEFELSLEDSDEPLNLEASADESASDSEFDLTLDDSGTPSAVREQELISEDDEQSDKDIFETDFEVPGLDDESGSQDGSTDGDTDLESSDFDIEDESGSQVVALDDSEVYDDEDQPKPKRGKTGHKPARQPKRPTRSRPAPAVGYEYPDEDVDQQGSFDQLDQDQYPEPYPAEPPPPEIVERIQYIRPAPWGVLPTIVMVPCVAVMLLLGIMAFEQTQSMGNGFKPDGTVTKMVKDLAKQMNLL